MELPLLFPLASSRQFRHMTGVPPCTHGGFGSLVRWFVDSRAHASSSIRNHFQTRSCEATLKREASNQASRKIICRRQGTRLLIHSEPSSTAKPSRSKRKVAKQPSNAKRQTKSTLWRTNCITQITHLTKPDEVQLTNRERTPGDFRAQKPIPPIRYLPTRIGKTTIH